MNKRVRKVMHVQPTFESIENQYEDELMGDPGPGLARQATEFILSPFYTRTFDDVMDKPSAQAEAVAGGLQPIPPSPNPPVQGQAPPAPPTPPAPPPTGGQPPSQGSGQPPTPPPPGGQPPFQGGGQPPPSGGNRRLRRSSPGGANGSGRSSGRSGTPQPNRGTDKGGDANMMGGSGGGPSTGGDAGAGAISISPSTNIPFDENRSGADGDQSEMYKHNCINFGY